MIHDRNVDCCRGHSDRYSLIFGAFAAIFFVVEYRKSPEGDMNIAVKNYPQLQQICWNRPDDAIIDGETALALYERNWRFVDQDAMICKEQDLVDFLVKKFGNGCLLAA
jgi:hypothetical protein